MNNFRSMKGEMLCPTKKEHNFNTTSKSSGSVEKYSVLRSAVFHYKYGDMDREAVEDFLEDYFENDYHPFSKVEYRKAKCDAFFKVNRYLDYDGRRCAKPKSKTLKFGGGEYYYKPDFMFKSMYKAFDKEIPMLSVISFSAGTQKNSWKKNGRSLDTSIGAKLETLGALLYALDVKRDIRGKLHGTFAIEVAYHSLTSENDGKKKLAGEPLGEISKNEETHSNVVSVVYVFRDGRWCYTAYGNVIERKSPFIQFTESLNKYKTSKKCSATACGKCANNMLCNYAYAPVPVTEEKRGQMKLEDVTLTDEQYPIANTHSGIIKTTATAGSGKTFLIIYRLMLMLLNGYDPKSFLFVSFSNIAVDEIKERIRTFLKLFALDELVNAEDICVSTINGICQRLIDTYWERFFQKKPSLIEDNDKKDLIKEILQKTDVELAGYAYENPLYAIAGRPIGIGLVLVKEFDTIKSKGITTFHEYCDYAISEQEALLSRQNSDQEIYKMAYKKWQIFEQYRDLMRERNLIDFADQRLVVEELMKLGAEEGINYIKEALPYANIVVDENQDTDEFQLKLIRLIMNNVQFNSAIFVGDYSQSIYSFRDTNPELFKNLDKHLDLPVKNFPLMSTMRFDQNIADLANEIVKLNGEDMEIKSRKPLTGVIPTLIGCENKKDEMAQIVNQVKTWLDAGEKPEDIWVIGTTNNFLASVQKALSEAGISALKNSERMIDNSKVIAAISLAEVFLNIDNTQALLVYLNDIYDNTFLQMPKEKVEEIVENKAKELKEFFIGSTLEEKTERFLEMFTEIDKGGDATFTEFRSRVEKKAKELSFPQLLTYIEKYSLYQSEDEVKRVGRFPSVELSTIWRAKGGEKKHVICSISQMDRSTLSKSRIEESRRIIFTMVTRAKQSVVITGERYRETDGENVYPNRFYNELEEIMQRLFMKKTA